MTESMRVLAVDTTGAHGSVAIVSGGELEGILGARETRPKHAESLLPTIEQLLRILSLRLEDVDGLAVAVGPGSFTGLRIGIAAVEGLSFATGNPPRHLALEATAFLSVSRRAHRSLIEAYRGGSMERLSRPAGSSTSSRAPCSSFEVSRSLQEPPSLVAGTGLLRHREAVEIRSRAFLADPSFFIGEEVARLGRRSSRPGRGAGLARSFTFARGGGA
jgi:tRNA threonylcarbamoyl adenosine modification protein YeaZ